VLQKRALERCAVKVPPQEAQRRNLLRAGALSCSSSMCTIPQFTPLRRGIFFGVQKSCYRTVTEVQPLSGVLPRSRQNAERISSGSKESREQFVPEPVEEPIHDFQLLGQDRSHRAQINVGLLNADPRNRRYAALARISVQIRQKSLTEVVA
jgi:hypothetical protein